jgi:hypothetical protein
LAVEGLLTISLAYLFYPEIKQIAEYFINWSLLKSESLCQSNQYIIFEMFLFDLSQMQNRIDKENITKIINISNNWLSSVWLCYSRRQDENILPKLFLGIIQWLI